MTEINQERKKYSNLKVEYIFFINNNNKYGLIPVGTINSSDTTCKDFKALLNLKQWDICMYYTIYHFQA